MKRSIIILFVITMSLSLPSLHLAEEVYYVQSLKAKIMSEPSFKGKVIGETTKGTKVTSSGREGKWVKIMLSQRTAGYVSSLLISKYPPINKVSVIRGEETDIKQSVRRRASTYTSAAAARGLAQDDRRRLSTEEKTDYHGLEKMEAVSISPEELTRFMEGNKI